MPNIQHNNHSGVDIYTQMGFLSPAIWSERALSLSPCFIPSPYLLRVYLTLARLLVTCFLQQNGGNVIGKEKSGTFL